MINALEGIPGSGKSYEAVVYHVLVALEKGRKVITNLPLDVERFAAINPDFRDLLDIRKFAQPMRGTWDANAANRGELAFVMGDVTPVQDVEIFGHVWDFWDEWKGEGGIGPLYVIDECHVCFPKADRSGRGTPKDVIQWFKIHRHYGADVLLMTQSFRDIEPSICNLIATLIKVRKADILGKKGSYIRKVHGGYRGGLVSTEERKYKPQYFDLYKSHTQGGAVMESSASDVTPFVAKWTCAFWSSRSGRKTRSPLRNGKLICRKCRPVWSCTRGRTVKRPTASLRAFRLLHHCRLLLCLLLPALSSRTGVNRSICPAGWKCASRLCTCLMWP